MADYIYLMQNRLTPAQWRALQALRDVARTHSMPLFLVGGAVRDLTSGSPVRDLDFAVQGDVEALIADLQGAGATVTGRHPALGSVYLAFRGGVRAELSPSLSVSYPKPGQPEAQPAPILDDLRRRDFTVNAMAVSLNEGSYGLLLDPLNGTADLENRELRLVSNYGFIEQPALLLRAARLGERLGFNLEERTAGRYQTAKDEEYIKALPASDRGYELEEIFHEEDPLMILDHMAAEGWQSVLFPTVRTADADRSGIEGVRDLIGQLEGQGIHPDPSSVYFPLLTAKMNDKDRSSLKQAFLRQGFVEQIETLEARAKELAGQLTSKAAALPSDSWRLLTEAEPDAVLWLAFHTRTGAVQAKIKAFLKDWPQMRQRIPYAMMQEMRITPDLPVYQKLLDDLFFALMDGKLDTPEAIRAFLEPFSPPAPPQVTVRRRPAKATRSRGKRAAAAEAVEEPEIADADSEDAEEEKLTPGRLDDPEEDDEDAEDAEGDAARGDSEEDDESDDEDGDDEEPAKSPAPKKTSPAPRAAAPAKKAAAAPAKQVVVVAAKATGSKALAPAKGTPEKGAMAVSPSPAKTAGKGAVAPVAAKAPSKAAPSKVPAKVPAKAAVAPAKSAAKEMPAKKAASIPAKKTVPAKAVPAKAAPVKVTAKGAAVTKAAPPAKAASKVASQGKAKR